MDTSRQLLVTIADQQNRLAVELTVGTGGRIKTRPFTIQTFTVFDGKSPPKDRALSPLEIRLMVQQLETVATLSDHQAGAAPDPADAGAQERYLG